MRYLGPRRNFLTLTGGSTVVDQNFASEPNTVIPAFSRQTSWNLEFLVGDLKLWHDHAGTWDIGRDQAMRNTANQGISVKLDKDFSIRFEHSIR